MRVHVSHKTVYSYEEPVPYGLQQVRLTPKSRAGQKVISWQMDITGGNKELEFEDQHNNTVALLSHQDGCSEIAISCVGEVETADNSGVLGAHGGYAPVWYFKRETELTKAGAGVKDLVKELGGGFDDTISKMHALSALVLDRMTYEIGTTGIGTTAEDALMAGRGVCQDHAHAFVSAARLVDIPARYVSGYLMMNDRVEQDAGHAWAEVHCGSIGWVGFDVSNGISPDERYVRVATGLDYRDAAPISGVRAGVGGESMHVEIQVQQ